MTRSKQSGGQRVFRWVTGLVIAGIALLNIGLMLQNRQLKDRIRYSIFQEFDPEHRLESFGGVDRQGRYREVELGFSPKRYLLLQFSTGCPYSRQNMDQWIRLEAEALDKGWTPVWISQDPFFRTVEFCRAFPIQGLVLSGLSYPDFSRLGLNFVPRTIAVDGSGEILKYWDGEIESRQWPELFEYFSSVPADAATDSNAAR